SAAERAQCTGTCRDPIARVLRRRRPNASSVLPSRLISYPAALCRGPPCTPPEPRGKATACMQPPGPGGPARRMTRHRGAAGLARALDWKRRSVVMSIAAEMHGYYLDDLKVGMSAVFGKTITDADIQGFAGVSGDTNPLHLHDDFART